MGECRMPIYNKVEVGRVAQEHGFVRDTFEKVLRLKEVLLYINEHEYLGEHLLLKGGTAINLSVFNLPRLSIDIDMDYTPNDTREDMFRKCFVFYATISAEKINRTFDTSAIDSLRFDKIRRDLFPVLSKKDNFRLEERKQQAKEYIAELMQLTERENEYMDRFVAKEYRPELLFEDEEIVERLKLHPMALWKCQ